jgi:hypothetical protein
MIIRAHEVQRLTAEAQQCYLEEIYSGLDTFLENNPDAEFEFQRQDVSALRSLGLHQALVNIIKRLDQGDGDDYFGTEGWRHTFGIDD